MPFHDVYVHGLVRDAQGRKMSKSLGNGIDPLEVIDQYGADALRFMLTTGITPGNDMRFKTDRLEASRNFANKLWNASRFVIMNLGDEEIPEADRSAWRDEDKWMISRVNDAVKYVTEAMEKYDLALAGQRVYDLIWNEYCDWYIEIVKERLYGDDEQDKQTARYVLIRALKDMLKLLHPFMPFITEEIWGFLPGVACRRRGKTLRRRGDDSEYGDGGDYSYPEHPGRSGSAAVAEELTAVIVAQGEDLSRIREGERYIRELANLTEITFTETKDGVPGDAMSAVIAGAQIFIPLEELVDIDAELERLTKEKQRLTKEVERAEKKLPNPGFVAKAPEKVVEEEKTKKARYEEMLEKVSQQLANVEKKAGK